MTALDPSAPADPTAAPQPGWYPDPQDSTGSADRWWNGAGWSEHRRRRAWTPPTAPPAPAVAFRTPARTGGSSAAWWSLGLGLLALAVALAVLLEHGSYVWVSTSGVLAVINGIRALRLRDRGPVVVVPAIIGIVAGSLGTTLMLLSLVVPVRFSTFVSTDDLPASGSDAAGPVAAAPLGSSTPLASRAPVGSPAPIPTPSQPLQAWAPSPLPDDQLTTYSAVPTRSITSASAGCGVLSYDPQALPLSRYTETEARQMQDWLSLQSQDIAGSLQSFAKDHRAWPSRLDEDPQSRVLFTIASDGSCLVLGAVPKGTELRYALSPDHGQSALALYNTSLKVGTLWRSVDDTVYWL
jgi:hypothetical protein